MSEFKGFDKDFSLEGKVAIVTGSAKGIGKAVALLFAEKGADIVLVDMDQAVKDTAAEVEKFGVKAFPLVYDISIIENCQKVVQDVLDNFDTIDILVNSAGVALVDDVEKITEEIWDKNMDVNAKALFFMSQAVGKEMIKNKKGKIVNLASAAGTIAFEQHAAYCASKAAVVMVTKTMAYEWAKHSINVNCLSPTVTLTEMGRTVWVGEVGENMRKQIPIGRFNEPVEIAAAALYLASDASNTITGVDLYIDGGYAVK